MNATTTTRLQSAIEGCACPRAPEQPLAAPHCAVDGDQGISDGPLPVRMPPQLACPAARVFPYGQFCVDEGRSRLFRVHGI